METKEIKFQIIDWRTCHEEDDEDENKKKFIIKLYGRTDTNKTILVKVLNFTPYFYIKLPKSYRKEQIDLIMEEVGNRVFPKENQKGLLRYEKERKYDFYGFTNYTLFDYIKLVFTDYDSMRSYSNVFRNKIKIPKVEKQPIKFQLYESNIEPFIRFMHIRQLEAVGWCKIDAEKYQDIGVVSCNDVNISVQWTDIFPVDERKIMPLVIASFDIECNSEDGSFPQAERDGDKIIQIGTTFSRFGEPECFYQNIITLGTCDDIEGAEVIRCKTEKEVLLEWTKLMRRTNPDIVTGYNIFGFDFSYMQRRAKKLGISSRFEKLSRDNNEDTPFQEKKLASSALGENILKYYDMTGRVMIDLMKVIQRDHKLESYKLDYVASWFIREEILKIEYEDKKNTIISTKNTYGVKKDQYITVFYNDGLTDNKHMDGKKFKILALTKDKLVVEGIIEDDIFKIKNNKIFWCNAKDDISPNEIFRCQEGTSKDRCKIARYCLMDCALCNKLMNKLQVITNNAGMANVCHVPLSYLFMRGQGVKIYSLVSKKCRTVNHLIPTMIKKEKKDKSNEIDKLESKKLEKFINNLNDKGKDLEEVDDEEDEGYEGATVFTPESGVHYDPIPVLDYASLYPNAMILRNLSHEMKVTDKTYDKLPGYRYHEITYKNGDGSLTTCRFAEKEDRTKGIIPEILAELLAARKKYKKLMEEEKDSFVKSILDGLQQAYKVTANSLYGQTGAPTSPIYMKEIAASTTATGREMLQFSKYFIENIYQKIIELAQTSKTKYMKFMEEIFKFHIHKFEFLDNTKVTDTDKKKELDMQNTMNSYMEGKNDKKINNEDLTLVTVCTDDKREIPAKKFMGVLGFINGKDMEETKYSTKEEFFEIIYKNINRNLENHDVTMNVIYGDSVTGDTPILIREDNIIKIKTIESLGSNWTRYAEKEEDKSVNSKYEVWSDRGWTKIKRVIRHKTLKDIYEVITPYGYVKVTEDHSLLLRDGTEITPEEVKIGTELLHSFPHNNTRNDYILTEYKLTEYKLTEYKLTEYKFTNQIEAMKKYYNLKSEGFDITLDKIENEIILKNKKSKNPYSIKKIIKLGQTSDYVYDLETENHHFHAGVGELIVHNTDSVFFKSIIVDKKTGTRVRDKTILPIAINIGIMASALINTALPDNMKQEYEKVLWPFAILSKKRYVGNLYETNPEKYKQKSMGIVLKRRDNAPIVKVVVGGIVDQILNKRSPEGAVEFTRKTLKKIFNDKYPIEKYIITKTLKDLASYKDPSSIVHAVLAEIMAERDPGNKPQANDRIPFVYKVIDEDKVLAEKYKRYMNKKNLIYGACECEFRKCDCYKKMCKRKKCVNNMKCLCHTEILQGDRVEHPTYLLENKLRIDYLFYITNQIMKPAIQFLELIIEKPESIFNEYIVREENRRSKKIPIDFFFKEPTNENLKKVSPKAINKDNESDSDSDDGITVMNTVLKSKEIKKKPTTRVSKKKVKKASPKENSSEDGFYEDENGGIFIK